MSHAAWQYLHYIVIQLPCSQEVSDHDLTILCCIIMIQVGCGNRTERMIWDVSSCLLSSPSQQWQRVQPSTQPPATALQSLLKHHKQTNISALTLSVTTSTQVTWPLVEDHGDSAAGAGFCGISCVSFSVDISTTAQPGYLESLSLYVGALLFYKL